MGSQAAVVTAKFPGATTTWYVLSGPKLSVRISEANRISGMQ